MPLVHPLNVLLLQAAAHPDTIIARTIPVRGFLDWTNGILELIVLVLAVVALGTFMALLITLRDGMRRFNAAVDRMAADAAPILANANAMAADARAMVANVRDDVERMTDAAGAVSDRLLDAADRTAERVDDVNAVLDVLQDELEGTVLNTAAAIRGVRVGADALASGLLGGRRRRRPRRSRDEPDAPGF